MVACVLHSTEDPEGLCVSKEPPLFSPIPQVAEHALFVLKHLSLQRDQLGIATGSLGCSVDWTREQEEAKLCWAKGEKTHAIHQMRSLLKKLEGVCSMPREGGGGQGSLFCVPFPYPWGVFN